MRDTERSVLIVGGSSGLGLELGKLFLKNGAKVYATCYKNTPPVSGFVPINFKIEDDQERLLKTIAWLSRAMPSVDTLVYAAGFFQEGRLDELPIQAIEKMTNIGLLAPALLARMVKVKCLAQDRQPEMIFITSTSQWVPREMEPMYAATKAALGALGASLGKDTEIGRVLVAAPAGMKTDFWKSARRDTRTFLDPAWVAQQIMDARKAAGKYRFLKILRNPDRTEVADQW